VSSLPDSHDSPDSTSSRRGRGPGLRTRSRETAVKFLYGCDLRQRRSMDGFDAFVAQQGQRGPEVDFARELADGVIAHWDEIDEQLAAFSDNWRLGRMAVVDRNILRVGVFELLHVEGTPPTVVINEAVELAKKFGARESGAFVNGILDRVRLEVGGHPPPGPKED